MARNLIKTDRTCPKCSTTFGAVANHCVCPTCSNRFSVDHFEPRKDPRVVEVPQLSSQQEDALNEIEERLSDAFGPDAHAQYSAYEYDSNGVAINNLSQIAVHGTIVLVAESDHFFGGETSRPYQSSPIQNPTWLDLCGILNEQIELTRDVQHVFLEGILDTGRVISIDGKSFSVYELDLGS